MVLDLKNLILQYSKTYTRGRFFHGVAVLGKTCWLDFIGVEWRVLALNFWTSESKEGDTSEHFPLSYPTNHVTDFEFSQYWNVVIFL